MKTIHLGLTKKTIFDIITKEVDPVSGEILIDSRSQNETPVQITNVPKPFWLGHRKLKEKILNNLEVCLLGKEDFDAYMKDIDAHFLATSDKWFNFGECGLKIPTGKHLMAERYPDGDMEVTDAEVAALTYFFNRRQSLPDVSSEAIEELLGLINV